MCMKNIYFNANNQEYFINPDTNLIYPKELEESITKERNVISKKNKQKYKKLQDVREKRYIGQLTLILTEECNIRCKYCIYSGQYDNMREHSSQVMSFETAKKAIDIYIMEYMELRKTNHESQVQIGFFGGEPLLNFKLLKQVVEYVRNKYQITPIYTITTNGLLLTDKKIEYLVSNNFNIAISINGDKANNDRLRTNFDGSGTYSSLEKLFSRLLYKYPEITERISLICIIDIGSNIDELNNFFDKAIVNKFRLARVNSVNADFTNWYNKYNLRDREKYLEAIETLLQDFKLRLSLHEKPTNFERVFFNSLTNTIVHRVKTPPHTIYKNEYYVQGMSCVPGDKLAVNPAGDLLMCERVNYSGKIGDVYNGIDINLITNHMNNYNKSLTKCLNCNYKWLCSCCFARVLDDRGNIIPFDSKRCSDEKASIDRALRIYYEILSVCPNYNFGIGE